MNFGISEAVKFLGCFFIVKFSKDIFCLYSALDYLCIAYFLISEKNIIDENKDIYAVAGSARAGRMR